MNAEELLKLMLRSYSVITTGILVSMYVFCLIFHPDVSFSLNDIGRVILLAVVSVFTCVIFLSRRELDKNQMLTRKVIHLIVISAVLLYFAFLWDWVNGVQEITVFLLSVYVVYAAVFFATRYRDKKLTDRINGKLKERFHS